LSLNNLDHTMPLTGIRVADFSTVMAGPYCTRILAGLGADVIKIEPPRGDYTRGAAPLRGSSSAYFAELNNGKRSVVLDLGQPLAKQAARALADASDVVVENMRPGKMERLGLDFDTLAREHAELIYCSITGFGQDSEAADRPATAQVVHALVGYDCAFMAYQGGESSPPATGLYAADGIAGALAVSGILAALRVRDLTGVGRHVDVALDQALLSMMTYEVQTAQFPPGYVRKGYRPVRTRDGYLMIAAVTQRNFAALCEAMGRPDLLSDSRFADTAPRWRAYDELHAIIEQWTLSVSTSECERRLIAAGVPAARYQTVADYLSTPGTSRRIMRNARDASGNLAVTGLPFRMTRSGEGTADSLPAACVPGLGADTFDVLCEVVGPRRARELIECGAAATGLPGDN
jgi:crotonobetainyl-CoA:carnitine CoA-transferase CaiB-like acyl-CoA transferase